MYTNMSNVKHLDGVMPHLNGSCHTHERVTSQGCMNDSCGAVWCSVLQFGVALQCVAE